MIVAGDVGGKRAQAGHACGRIPCALRVFLLRKEPKVWCAVARTPDREASRGAAAGRTAPGGFLPGQGVQLALIE